jgi:tetratricopeptide (TPR) repeat protein
MEGVPEDIRSKAAAAVVSLADRAAARGRSDQPGGPGKPGWVTGADGRHILPRKLREALAYYDIALSIHPDAFWRYTQALLQEELGDFAEAEAAFLALDGTAYGQFGQQAAERCRQKQAGTWDEDAAAQAWLKEQGIEPISDDDMADLLEELEGMEKILEAGGTLPVPETDSLQGDGPMDNDDLARQAATDFVDLLLAQDYDKAQAMLHSSMSDTGADELKEAFESMFEDEDFPESAQAFSSFDKWPDKWPEDLASVYVTIDSEEAEAVTVIVTREAGKLRIREIEWGRA